MAARKKRSRFPERKISETFLDFASPLLELAAPGVAKEDVEEAFRIAFTTWNAVVFDAVDGDDRFVSKLRELTADDPVSTALLEQMLSRKRREFADDERVIGDYKIYRKDGEWRLWAEARDPRPGHPPGRSRTSGCT